MKTRWVLLRGLTREAGHWGSFPTDFQQALPGSTVICLDLPGNGEFHRTASPLLISSMVTFCRNELIRCGHRPPYYLLAMSLGAMVAIEWCYVASDEIDGCVLINTSLRVFSPFYRRLQPRNYLPLLRGALLARAAADAEWLILQLTSNSPKGRAQVLDSWVQMRINHPVSNANTLRQLAAALRYRARSQTPLAAVLILCSQHDALVHVSCSLAIASHWECPVQVHPCAGHDIALDYPHWVIEKVQRWLEQQQPSSQAPSSSTAR